ncbi:MAG: ATP-grasp domain-containing protein [Aurantibacter sp.]
MKIGIVTCEKVESLVSSEQPLIPLFRQKNFIAEAVVWNDPEVSWKEYSHLLIRSVWDYHLDPTAFSKWLDQVENYGIKTLNSIETIRANQHKFYLRGLEDKGVEIVPTVFIDKTKDLNLSSLKDIGWRQAVIKPAISASSFFTEAFVLASLGEIENKYRSLAQERDLLIQKFMPEVRTFGELSIIFFNRKYSHTVLKRATANEFRVQSEFGGTTRSYQPNMAIIATASDILSRFDGPILYARVDGLIRDGRFILMEIELIEPHLFFEFEKMSIERFVKATLEIISNEKAV